MKKPIQKAIKLATAEINGKKVDFYEPPHMEPDFPWVDVFQLACAFLPKGAAKAMLKNGKGFDGGNSVITVASRWCISNDPVPRYGTWHVHGHWTAWRGRPRHSQLTQKPLVRSPWNTPMTPEESLAAFNNSGGPFTR